MPGGEQRMEECTPPLPNGPAQTAGPWGSPFPLLPPPSSGRRTPLCFWTDVSHVSLLLLCFCQMLGQLRTAQIGFRFLSARAHTPWLCLTAGRGAPGFPLCAGLAAGTRPLLGWQRNPVQSLGTKTKVEKRLEAFTEINEHPNTCVSTLWRERCCV